jgi:hypothetical protein
MGRKGERAVMTEVFPLLKRDPTFILEKNHLELRHDSSRYLGKAMTIDINKVEASNLPQGFKPVAPCC